MDTALRITACRISSVTDHAGPGAWVRRMRAFEDKVTHFQWVDLDGKHGTLHVWEDEQEAARLVLFTDDETVKTYVVVDQTVPGTY
jgi:hypothetical protein